MSVPQRAALFALLLAIGLMGVKFGAWALTGSAAILSDAVESLVNVAASALALYSLRLSAQPRDSNHPYGHGKIEFISSGVEGALILLAALGIVYEAIQQLLHPQPLNQLGWGLALVGLAGLANLAYGWWMFRLGRQLHSLALEADGRHLMSDAVSSAALLLGLGLVWLTDLLWLDSVIALLMATYIGYIAVGLLRRSVAGLMDETSDELVAHIAATMHEHAQPHWVDFHNLRIQQFGHHLHLDCHLTLPWYYNLRRVEDELHAVEQMLRAHSGREVEVFLHADPCLPSSCPLCPLADCAERQQPFTARLEWTPQRLQLNRRHGRKDDEPVA